MLSKLVVICESILDPYHLVAKIDSLNLFDSKHGYDGQRMVSEAFDQFINRNHHPRVSGSTHIHQTPQQE